MLYVFRWGFAEVQSLKNLSWPYLWNRMEYFDELS